MKAYAGIGSRSTPKHILEEMEAIGSFLALKGYVLRSGGAQGADTAFEKGCDAAGGAKEIFLPWKGFNGSSSTHYLGGLNQVERDIVFRYHPAPEKLSSAGMRLMARNIYQLAGLRGEPLSEFIVCWTPNGALSGGTSFAMRIAMKHNIRIINLATEKFPYDEF